jgi:threonine dehydrogenase-like Zn-dependent dehydrogenase
VHAATLFAPRAITALDLVGSRLRVARRLGATRTIDGRDDVVAMVMEATGGRGADVVVDAVGAPSTLLQASEMVGVGGRIALVGIPERAVELPLSTLFMKNVRLSMGLAHLGQIDRMIALIAAGRLDTTPLITHRMRLSQIEHAFRMFEAQDDEVIKIAVKP